MKRSGKTLGADVKESKKCNNVICLDKSIFVSKDVATKIQNGFGSCKPVMLQAKHVASHIF